LSNDLQNVIQTAENELLMNKFDTACKKILEFKEVLSRILEAVIDDFHGMEYSEIEKLIGAVTIDYPLNADMPLVQNVDTETASMTDGTRRFDLKFPVMVPSDNSEYEMIINIEAQKAFVSEKYVHKRAEYYTSRLISGQYGKKFTESDFDKIKRVRSVWICLQPTEAYRNSVTVFERGARVLGGNPKITNNIYDTSSYVIVGLNGNLESGINLVKFLDTLFSVDITPEEKSQRLDKEFGIAAGDNMKKELRDMCDFSKAIYEQGVEQGIERGVEQGIENVVVNMLTANMPLDIIEKATALTENAIFTIAKKFELSVSQ
jgi:hypothetical protein